MTIAVYKDARVTGIGTKRRRRWRKIVSVSVSWFTLAMRKIGKVVLVTRDHWVQAIGIVVAIMAGLGAFAGWTLHLHDLEQGAITTMIDRMSKDEERIARNEEKWAALEREALQNYADQQAFQVRVQAGLDRLSDQLTQILTRDGHGR